jgi:hypothetical protein
MINEQTFKRTTALPAAAASASCTYIDLGSTAPLGGVQTPAYIEITHPTTASLVNAKTITYDVLDCATSGGSYVVVTGVGNMIVTGAGGVGAATTKFTIQVPRSIRQFVKVRATVESGGGDSTAASFVVNIGSGV